MSRAQADLLGLVGGGASFMLSFIFLGELFATIPDWQPNSTIVLMQFAVSILIGAAVYALFARNRSF